MSRIVPLTVGVDFDGTVVRHEYPDVGPDVPGAVDGLRAMVASGARLVLWTMRDGDKLDDAVAWFAARGIDLWGINENPEQKQWTHSRKAYCHVYVDDAAFGCPLIKPPQGRAYVDWSKVGDVLVQAAQDRASGKVTAW